MRLLITDLHHGNGGGHVTYVCSLLEAFNAYSIVVAAPSTGRLYQRASAMPGVDVVPALYTSRPFTLLKEVLKLRRFIKEKGFDVVHVNGGADHRHVMLACLGMSNRPAIVWTKHNTRPIRSLGNRLRARFGTDAAIAGCQYVARMLENSAYRRNPVRVVPQVIDTMFFRPASSGEKAARRQQWFGPLSDDVLVFGSIAGTDHDKGWLLLVQALARLEPVLRQRMRIIVAGDPPADGLRAQVTALGLADLVVFPGLVTDVRAVMAACDVGFVLSTHEAGSYACCETMAMGLPALVTDVGGLPENVQDGSNGWVVPSEDVGAVEQRVRALLSDHACLASMGRAARSWAEKRFAIPTFVADTEAVYRLALQRAGREPASEAGTSIAG